MSFWGDIETEKGGSDLIFEQYLDDQTTADVVWIKRVIMHCMEVLFYKEKWEKLVDIILRFNALSRYVNTTRFMSVVLFTRRGTAWPCLVRLSALATYSVNNSKKKIPVLSSLLALMKILAYRSKALR